LRRNVLLIMSYITILGCYAQVRTVTVEISFSPNASLPNYQVTLIFKSHFNNKDHELYSSSSVGVDELIGVSRWISKSQGHIGSSLIDSLLRFPSFYNVKIMNPS